MNKSDQPYIQKTEIVRAWNPDYNQDAVCSCGHLYYRHFDSYDDMRNVGCKYCDCGEFVCSLGAS